jgi:hypothetical protein
VAYPLAGPLTISMVPAPDGDGLIVPEMLHVVTTVAMKLAVAFAPLIEIVWLAGVNVYPALLGVTVYWPFCRPVKP